jgi:N6-L-threonylcarbamoyladenine synthase
MGRTRDDAAGEAFDKVGKLLGLGFPGGPAIEKTAQSGNPKAVTFPRARLGDHSLDFSFSGLKTAVLNHVQTLGAAETAAALPDITAGFQRAAVDALVRKTLDAARRANVRSICLAGGVAVNKTLQAGMREEAGRAGMEVFFPPPALCADNAGMIAATGHYYLARRIVSPLTLGPSPSLNL